MSFLENARAKLQKRDLVNQGGANLQSTSLHTYDPREKERYAARINKIMANEPGYVPVNPAGDEVWARMADGEFMCRLLNKCEPNAVPESILKKTKPGATTSFHNSDTVTHFISAGRKIGLEMIGLGATDFTRAVEEHKEHLIMGAVWQMLRRQLANEIKEILKRQEEEAEKRGKKLANYSALMAKCLKDPESYLCDWVNETMKQKGVPLANNGKGATCMADLSLGSSDTLLRLMHALDPNSHTTPEAIATAGAADTTGAARAANALDWVADHAIVTLSNSEDLIVSNPRQLMPFVLQLFTWVSQQPGKESLYVVRSHTHNKVGDSGKALSASVSVGVYKIESEALQLVPLCEIHPPKTHPLFCSAFIVSPSHPTAPPTRLLTQASHYRQCLCTGHGKVARQR